MAAVVLEGHEGRCFHSAVRESEDTWLATASEDGAASIRPFVTRPAGTVRVWSVAARSCVAVLGGERDEVLRVAWANRHVETVAEGAVLAAGGANGRCVAWRLTAASQKPAFEVDAGDQIYGCEWLDEWLATACGSRLVVWDLATSRHVSTRSYSGQVFDTQLNPGGALGSLLACAVSDGSVVVHDYREPRLAATLRSGENRATAVSWDPSGNRLVACYGSGVVDVFDVANWRSHGKRTDHDSAVYGATWRDDATCVSWAGDILAVWQPGQEPAQLLLNPGFPIFHAAKCPTLLAICGGGQTKPYLALLDLKLLDAPPTLSAFD